MEDEKLYQAGFNSGYLLAKHEPELATKILDSVRNQHGNEYCVGLTVGHDTYVIDRIIEQNKAQDKDVNLPDKNKDDREREN